MKVLITLESQGFVENLSRFSPSSSNKYITLSAVQTAYFWLFADQVIAAI